MTSRKDKGDAAERARQRYWEAQGAVVFPVSPSYPGVDLIVFLPSHVLLSEVKGQKAKLYGKTKADALAKVKRDQRRIAANGHFAAAELVHLRNGKWEVLG
jgi:Holliday junction resolvase